MTQTVVKKFPLPKVLPPKLASMVDPVRAKGDAVASPHVSSPVTSSPPVVAAPVDPALLEKLKVEKDRNEHLTQTEAMWDQECVAPCRVHRLLSCPCTPRRLV